VCVYVCVRVCVCVCVCVSCRCHYLCEHSHAISLMNNCIPRSLFVLNCPHAWPVPCLFIVWQSLCSLNLHSELVTPLAVYEARHACWTYGRYAAKVTTQTCTHIQLSYKHTRNVCGIHDIVCIVYFIGKLHVYVRTCLFHVCVCAVTCAPVCVCAQLHVHLCVSECAYVCTYVCTCVCMCAPVCVWVCLLGIMAAAHTGAHIHTQVHT